jgi:hypothetical protein
LAIVFVVTVGLQTSTIAVGLGVSDTGAMLVNVGVGVSVLFSAGGSVGVDVALGRLQAIAASPMKSADTKTFLFFASMKDLL